MDMRGKHVVLYTSGVAMALAALSASLTYYMQHPNELTPQKVNEFKIELTDIQAELEAGSAPVVPVPVAIDTVMGWWYPGEPACDALIEVANANLEVVKPEYFVIRDGGRFEFMTEERYGCNGYSEANIAAVKRLAPEQFVMVSASYAQDMDAFLRQDERTGEYTDRLVSFAVETGFTGVELDFEDFGGWTPDIYERYKAFVTRLGNALHAEGKELMLALPAVRNETEEQWYTLRLAELERLPVDHLVIMGYDYQYDHGAGQPVAPLDWLAEVVRFSQQRVSDDSKLVIGVPSYGYEVDAADGRIRITTAAQAATNPLYATAERDPRSMELIAKRGGSVLVYQDAVSIQAKLDTIAENGIGRVSIWHFGGNPWIPQ